MPNMRAVVRSVAERGMGLLPRRTARGDRLVLAYHNVVPDTWVPRGDRSLHLTAGKFSEQLRLIRTEADIVPLWELLTTRAPNTRRVAITFDDAYASALELGVTACQQVQAPCTVFVTPGLLGTVPYWDRAANSGAWSERDRQTFLWEEQGRGRPFVSDGSELSTQSVLTIASETLLTATSRLPGVTYGNHTMGHPNLGALSVDDARDELLQTQSWLTAHYAAQCIPVVAFPYGIPPVDLRDTLPHAGLDFGLMVAGGWAQSGAPRDALAFPRWNVPAGISSRGFRLRLRGWLHG